MHEAWSDSEVKIIIEDYFNMLTDELAGKPVNKALHRRALLPLLNNRSEGSIEFKHQNISAVLATLGQPFIKGYLPRYNYQKLLENFVLDYLTKDLNIEELFRGFSDKNVATPIMDFQSEKFLVNPPMIQTLEEPVVSLTGSPIKINYLQREQNNQKLGKLGEELVILYEKWHLNKLGKSNLAGRIEWISQTRGDGTGFDILSRNFDGSDKYIEVKTTKLSKETPFYFTNNELRFSIGNQDRYHLYRLFNFDQQPRMFIKDGDFKTICKSEPVVFKGYF